MYIRCTDVSLFADESKAVVLTLFLPSVNLWHLAAEFCFPSSVVPCSCICSLIWPCDHLRQ